VCLTNSALDGFKVELWFPVQDKLYPEGATEITGGTSAIARAPFAAHTLGWRDMTIFGADSSFEDSRYCYRDVTFQEDSKSTFQVVEVKGERFLTDLSLMHQVSQLGVIAEHFQGILRFDCDGLLSA
jgi:hypothetical protein